MASLSVLIIAFFVFACVGYTHSEPIPTAELILSPKTALKQQVFALERGHEVPTEMPVEPSTAATFLPRNGFISCIKRIVFFIPKALINSLRILVNTVLSIGGKGGKAISDILEKLVKWMSY